MLVGGIRPHLYCLPILKVRPTQCKLTLTTNDLAHRHAKNFILVSFFFRFQSFSFDFICKKAEIHRKRLVEAATSGSPKFFLGTDSAPHPTFAKQSGCGCAGVFSAHCAIELYAQVFDEAGHLDRLEAFSSFNGADHYGIPRNTVTMTLEKKPWKVPMTYQFGRDTVTPLKMGEEIQWTIVS